MLEFRFKDKFDYIFKITYDISMDNQEIENLIKKVQADKIKLSKKQELEILKMANQKLVELNNWLKDIV